MFGIAYAPLLKVSQSKFASFTHLLATQVVNLATLVPFLTCRLIRNYAGVPPIGICEVTWMIVSKAILQVVNDELRKCMAFCKSVRNFQQAWKL